MTQVHQDRVRKEPLRARPERTPADAGPSSQHRSVAGWAGDVLVRQGAPDSREVVAPWRPAAAGGVIAAGGALLVVLGIVGVELLNIVLVAGLTMLVAGIVDGTGRRYRGPGVGLTTVGIVPRFFDAIPWLADGWAFGVFLLAYGAYVAVQRRRHPELAAR